MKNLIFSLFLITLSFAEQSIVDVVHVVDGDTIKIRHNNKTENVRMIGVDAPEVYENSRLYRESKKYGLDVKTSLKLGRRARDFLIEQLKFSKKVKLEFDVEKRDQYGRMLAYIYTPDNIELNALLVEKGLIRSYPVYPNTSHRNHLEELQDKAQDNKLGIWKYIPEDLYDGKK